MANWGKRIRFIVTGDLERAAVVNSVSRLFPPHTHEGESVDWLRPRQVSAVTTNRIRAAEPPSNAMQRLAKALVAEAWEGEDGRPADLVVALDDVEINNFDQPQLICDHFRAAIDLEFQRRELSMTTEQRMRAVLRERCSFHLLCPMVEAYFFGEPDALRRAGCAQNVEAQLIDTNVENFESCDPDFLPTCVEINQRKASPPNPMPWWSEERHAKHYLEHLVERNGGFYDEVVGGKAAFATLAWARVPADHQSIALMRAMFEDLSDFFGMENPLGSGATSAITYPQRKVDRSTLVLRNL